LSTEAVAEGAAEAVTEVVQAAAKPVAFFAILAGAALVVAVVVRRFGASLPLPDHLVEWVRNDDDEDDDDE
jgi:hypothetical protein